MNVEKFLEDYEQAIRQQSDNHLDRALYQLLMAFHKEIEPMYKTPGYFHKAFRQVDVVGIREGRIDSAIWNLLHASKLFWEIFAKHTQKDEAEHT